MLFLRVFLYLICTLSAGWSILFFAGPAILQKSINMYSDGALMPTDISLSPTFDVNIGRLDFNLEAPGVKVPFSGFSRATEISWSLFSERPFLSLNFGPTVIRQLATVESLVVQTPTYGKLDWSNLYLTLNTKNLKLFGFGEISDLSVDGIFKSDHSKISNLNFEAKSVNGEALNSLWKAGFLSATFPEVDVKSLRDSQFASGSFYSADIEGFKGNLKALSATGLIYASGKEKNIKIYIEDVTASNFGGFAEVMNADVGFDRDNRFTNLAIDFANGVSLDGLPHFSNVSTDILKVSKNKFTAYVNGASNELDLFNNDNFIGLLPKSTFKMNLEMDLINDFRSNLGVNFDITALSEITSSVEGGVKLNHSEDIFNCPSGECYISHLDFVYRINFDEELIKGHSRCLRPPCGLSNIDHTITTSNTPNIFNTINQSGLLSPLTSIYLYSVISSGQKINSGHILKF